MLSVTIGVQHTEVPNLGVVSDAFSDRWLVLLSFAIWVQHTKVPNLGVVSGFSDSQLLLLSVLHNTATEQNTETLVFAVRLSQTETATAVFFAVLPQPHCT